MKYKVEINGIDVEAEYSKESIDNIFMPLLKELNKLQKEKGRRILVMLAAAPGTGKSTLCQFLKFLSDQEESFKKIQIIGMDGFHHYQDYLLSHTTVRDGKEIKMVEIKGAPITFDLELLTKRIGQVASGQVCGWPEYNRLLHNPTDNAITIDSDIVLLEGNYLLLNEPGWDALKDYADYTIRILANPEDLYERLVDRKAKSGTDYEAAKRFVEYSDMVNARLCLENSLPGDLNLKMVHSGEYVND